MCIILKSTLLLLLLKDSFKMAFFFFFRCNENDAYTSLTIRDIYFCHCVDCHDYCVLSR